MKMNVQMNAAEANRRPTGVRGSRAFTLVELLTVIAIIALLAGLVVGGGSMVAGKARGARMNSEHQRLVTAIEAYKAELGFYPPDNALMAGNTNEVERIKLAGMSPLFYELSGATFEKDEFITQNKEETALPADLFSAFGVKGISNSSRQKREIPFRGVSFKPDQYREVDGTWTDIEILAAPVEGPNNSLFPRKGVAGGINAWLYDASSSLRHNPESFDLWIQYAVGKQTNTIGNWKN